MERYRATHRRQDVIRSGTRSRWSSDVARGPDRPTAELARRCSRSSDDVQPRQRPHASWCGCGGALAVVTPDMHRVHHSIGPKETNINFGFNFAVWDWLFGTYRERPVAGHTGMTIGIAQFREPRELWLDRMLTQPLREDPGPQPFNGRPAALTSPAKSDTSAP